ncbi:MAG: hypothetical protein WBW88_13535 [Rhodothermales bacterium]
MTLYAAVLETEGFTVGQDNSRSGLFRQEDDGSWTSLGWHNIRNFGIAISADYIFLASGNGVLRSGDDGKNWRMTTDWKITEVLDIALDPDDPHKLIIATAHGIAWSPDDGDTWHTNNDGLASTFVQSIVFEPGTSGVRRPESGGGASPARWLAGTEKGVFEAVSLDSRWNSAALGDVAVRQIAINAKGVCAVATDGSGLWLGTNKAGGPLANWEQATGLPSDASFYAAAVSNDGRSIATGGFRTGVRLSRDGGESWDHLTDGLTNLTIQALSFRPGSDELWAGTSGGGAFRLEGKRFVSEGLPGSTIRKFYFDSNR